MSNNSKRWPIGASQPPYTNRGVTNSPTPPKILDSAEFDWYSATVETLPIQQLITDTNQFFVCDIKGGKPDRPYTQAIDVFLGSETIFKASYGGVNPGIFIKASGENSPRVAEFIREYYPVHGVPRFDTCIDFDEPDAFNTLHKIALLLADEYNLKFTQYGDWREDGKDGRTIYLGSRKSTVFIRIYEKGKEQRTKNLDPDASLDWVRLELEIKPAKRADKHRAATMQPAEAFATSRSTMRLAQILGSENMQPIPLGTKRKTTSELDKRIAYMLHQYGDTLQDALTAYLQGDKSKLGDFLIDRIPEAKRAIQGRRIA